MKVTKDTLLHELATSREAAEILFSKGLHCLGCHAAQFETLEQGCKGHGMDDKDIKELVEKLSKI